MNDTRQELIFPLFALFVIFSDELFFSFFYVSKVPIASGMKSLLAIFIAAVAGLMITFDIIKGRITQRNIWQFAFLLGIMILYVITGFLYPHNYEYQLHMAHLLAYGGLCVPAAYVGMRLARGGYERRVMFLLPYFLLVVSISVGSAVMMGFNEGKLLGGGLGSLEGNGLTYQNSSYYMSFCLLYSLFYVFFTNNMKRNTWQKVTYLSILPLVLFCAVGTIVGGGRGAFVCLMVGTVYMVYRIVMSKVGGTWVKNCVMLISAVIAMTYLASHYEIFESAGAQRVSLHLMHDDGRVWLRQQAFEAFGRSPIIGNGLGSIWWEVGFYSHNILADLLAETGVVGTLIAVVFFATILIRLARGSKENHLEFFLLLIYLGHMVHDTFSGYWFSSPCLFLVYGYVYGKPQIAKWRYRLN